jgi:hypothetical protein
MPAEVVFKISVDSAQALGEIARVKEQLRATLAEVEGGRVGGAAPAGDPLAGQAASARTLNTELQTIQQQLVRIGTTPVPLPIHPDQVRIVNVELREAAANLQGLQRLALPAGPARRLLALPPAPPEVLGLAPGEVPAAAQLLGPPAAPDLAAFYAAKARLQEETRSVAAKTGAAAQAAAPGLSDADAVLLARSLGLRRGEGLAGVIDPSRILGRGSSAAPPIEPSPPLGEVVGARGERAALQTGAIQSISHSFRAVADTYLYRVNPAAAEFHRALSTTLALSGTLVGVIASIGISAAALLGVTVFSKLLGEGKKEAEELRLSLRLASDLGDLGGLEKIAKESQTEITKLTLAVEDYDKALAKANEQAVASATAGLSPTELIGGPAVEAAQAAARARPESSPLEREREAAVLRLRAAQDAIDHRQEELAIVKQIVKEETERIEIERLRATEAIAAAKIPLELAKTRVAEEAKLAEGERALQLGRLSTVEHVVERETRGVRLTETQGTALRQGLIEERRRIGLEEADEKAAKSGNELALARSGIEAEITLRRRTLATTAGLTPPQRVAAEIDIANLERQRLGFEDRLGFIEATRLQARRRVEDEAVAARVRQQEDEVEKAKRRDEDLFKHREALGEVTIAERQGRLGAIAAGGLPGFDLAARRSAQESLYQSEKVVDQLRFDLKRTLGEASLQDELRRIQAEVDAAGAGTVEKIQLEKTLADEKTKIRTAQESALGRTLEYLGIKPEEKVTAESLEQRVREREQAAEVNRQRFAGGGEATRAQLEDALRSAGLRKELGLLGAPPAEAFRAGVVSRAGERDVVAELYERTGIRTTPEIAASVAETSGRYQNVLDLELLRAGIKPEPPGVRRLGPIGGPVPVGPVGETEAALAAQGFGVALETVSSAEAVRARFQPSISPALVGVLNDAQGPVGIAAEALGQSIVEGVRRAIRGAELGRDFSAKVISDLRSEIFNQQQRQ